MIHKFFVLFISMGLFTAAQAEDSVLKVAEDAKEASYVLCKNKATVRTIRVQSEKGLCKTTYTKEGVDQIVGQGQAEMTCYGILNNIKGNLEKADWKCKDISQARISSSEG